MKNLIYKIIHHHFATVAAVGIGAITNLVGFFFIAFLFAGTEGDVWVRSYFEAANGAYFIAVTLVIAVLVFPLTIKMNIVRKRKHNV